MWLGNRLERMYAARPRHARKPHEIMPDIRDSGDIEWAQLLAFEDGVEEWWLVMPDWFEEGMGE